MAARAAVRRGLGARRTLPQVSSRCWSTAATCSCSSASRFQLRAALDDGADAAARGASSDAHAARCICAPARGARSGPTCRIGARSSTQVLRTRRRASRDGRARCARQKISRREALQAGAGLRLRDRRELLARFVAFMAQRARPVLEPPLRRRRAAITLERCRGVDEGNEIVYVPCHRSHMDYLLLSYVDLPQGLCRAAHRGRHQPEHAGGRPLPAQGRRVLPPPQLRRQRALHGGVHEVPRPRSWRAATRSSTSSKAGAAAPGRLLQPKTGMLSMTVRSYLRDPRRPGGVRAGVFRLRAARRGRAPTSASCPGGRRRRNRCSTLLRALPRAAQRFGKVHVSFGEPIRARRPARTARCRSWRRAARETDERPAWLAPLGRRARRAASWRSINARGLRDADQPARDWRCSRRRDSSDAREPI